MRALGLGAFLQHRRASGPRRRPTSGPRPRVPHVVDPGCVGVEASTPHQPWVPSRDSSGTPVGTLLGVSLPLYACSAPPPLRARVKGRVGVSPRERDAIRVRVGCGWCSTRRLSLCAVAGWPQHAPCLQVSIASPNLIHFTSAMIPQQDSEMRSWCLSSYVTLALCGLFMEWPP